MIYFVFPVDLAVMIDLCQNLKISDSTKLPRNYKN